MGGRELRPLRARRAPSPETKCSPRRESRVRGLASRGLRPGRAGEVDVRRRGGDGCGARGLVSRRRARQRPRRALAESQPSALPAAAARRRRRRRLPQQHRDLSRRTPVIPAERAGLSDHAVAGNQVRDRVARDRRPDRACCTAASSADATSSYVATAPGGIRSSASHTRTWKFVPRTSNGQRCRRHVAAYRLLLSGCQPIVIPCRRTPFER